MKLNELVCPHCGLKCLTECVYTTCASCQYFFYASESRSVKLPPSNDLTGTIVIGPMQVQPLMPWVVTPYPPGSGSITVSTTDNQLTSSEIVVQSWN